MQSLMNIHQIAAFTRTFSNLLISFHVFALTTWWLKINRWITLGFRRWCQSYTGSRRAVGDVRGVLTNSGLYFLVVVNRWMAYGSIKLCCLSNLRCDPRTSPTLAHCRCFLHVTTCFLLRHARTNEGLTNVFDVSLDQTIVSVVSNALVKTNPRSPHQHLVAWCSRVSVECSG